MNRLKWMTCILLCAMGLAWTASAAPTSFETTLHDAEGKDVGNVKLTQLEQGVKIDLQVRNLPPGQHAFHVHEVGKCTGPDFKSAGDHFSPSERKHGFNTAGGPHAGDMPNLIVKSDGTVSLEIINSNITLSKGANSLFKPGGTALVIHSRPDDHVTQPSGDAGDRIACAEIKAKWQQK
ncbi:MAG: superoxide dismutase family protein [Bdellovibrionia bacterium]